MKKNTMALIIVLLLASLYVKNASAETLISRSLQIGSRGKDVASLQKFLAADTLLYPSGLVTGYFGKDTQKAIKLLQSNNGLPPVGIVGPRTRELLGNLSLSSQGYVLAANNNSGSGSSNALNMPTGLSLSSITANSVTINWTDTNANETGYSVERATNSAENFIVIVQTAANITSYKNTGLLSGNGYFYRVRAFVNKPKLNYSPYSAIVSATTLDNLPPSMPKGVTATALSCSQILISWQPSSDTGGSGLKSYTVDRKGPVASQIITQTTSATDSGLTASSTYTYKVLAADNAGNLSAWSSSINVTTPLCPVASTTTSIFGNNQPGWPIRVAYGGWNFVSFRTNSPVVGDINNDGIAEIAIGDSTSPNAATTSNPYGGDVYVWDSKGNNMPGWPKHFGYDIIGKPVFADIDPSYPGKEIIFGVQGSVYQDILYHFFHMALPAKVYAFHVDGTPVSGWPKEINDLINSGPAVGDIDGDGYLEITMSAQDLSYGANNSIYVWRHDGSVEPGWPKNVGPILATPALADINKDGKLDIIAGTSGYGVYAWKYDGSVLAGWPVNLKQPDGYIADIRSSIAVGDLNKDGNLEIVVPEFSGNSTQSRYVYVLKSDGSTLSGWPVAAMGAYSSPALADINGDGSLEIVFGTYDNKVHAYDYNGSELPGWPVLIGDPASSPSLTIISSPAVADIDGDGQPEIIIGSHSVVVDPITGAVLSGKEVFALHKDGTAVNGFPLTLNPFKYTPNTIAQPDPNGMAGNSPIVDGSPAIKDIDNNGKVELIFASDNGSVYIIQTLGAESGVQWRMFHADETNTGFHP